MAIRYYLLPIEQVGSARGPKYFNWRFTQAGSPLQSPWSMMDYGIQNTALLASDISNPDRTSLTGNSDVTEIPANIDNNVTAGALSAVRSALEALWLPGNWVTTGHTYRQVLRVVAGIMQFAQRYHALHNEPLMSGAPNLSLTLGDLSAERRQKIDATAIDLGYTSLPGYSSLTLASTLRDVLKFLGEAWGNAQFIFGAITTL